jgi:hypothetical protein
MWRFAVPGVVALVLAPTLAHAKLTLDITAQPDGSVDLVFDGTATTPSDAFAIFEAGSREAVGIPVDPLGESTSFPPVGVLPLEVTLADGVGAVSFGEQNDAFAVDTLGWAFGGLLLTVTPDADAVIAGNETVTWDGDVTLPAASVDVVGASFADIFAERTFTTSVAPAVFGAKALAPVEVTVSQVPVPAALPLLASGVAALGVWRRCRRRAAGR